MPDAPCPGDDVTLLDALLVENARLREALAIIALRAGEVGCEHVTTPRSACRKPNSGRRRISVTGTADQWCDACVALDVLGAPFRG